MSDPIVSLVGSTREVAPGLRAAIGVMPEMPRHVIAELVPVGGGTYRVVPRLASAWLDLNRENIRLLGIGISQSTMLRLGRAGLIRIRQTSPQRWEFCLQSWLEHCEAVERDPEYWETPVTAADGRRMTRRQLYAESL